MLWVKCDGIVEHVPGSWPSVPKCPCLPPSPPSPQVGFSVVYSPLSGTPHTNQSPPPLHKDGCCPLLLAWAWVQHWVEEDGWALITAQPGLTAPRCIPLVGGELLLHSYPDPEHILTLRFKNPWGSPSCCGLGRHSPCWGALSGLRAARSRNITCLATSR